MMKSRVADYVASSLQLSMLLEVSAYPKPGNVDRLHNFKNTTFEDFLGSIAGLGSCWRRAALGGCSGAYRIGRAVLEASKAMLSWQDGGNTSFGTILLLAPLAVAAGSVLVEESFDVERLRAMLRNAISVATYRDTIAVYKAIALVRPGGLGRSPELDVGEKRSLEKINRDRIPLQEVFRLSSGYDSISREWCTGFEISFTIGYPYFTRSIQKGEGVNSAVVNTYLRILSEIPDTLIARKAGARMAESISEEAGEALKAGGLSTTEGRGAVERLDRRLREDGNLLNPGTTADLTCASVAIAVLSGFRP
ncbi:MAG: triphosphoribosyl-dephospho-CoA synthase [Candidatus Bathyarchaeia archaeon]